MKKIIKEHDYNTEYGDVVDYSLNAEKEPQVKYSNNDGDDGFHDELFSVLGTIQDSLGEKPIGELKALEVSLMKANELDKYEELYHYVLSVLSTMIKAKEEDPIPEDDAGELYRSGQLNEINIKLNNMKKEITNMAFGFKSNNAPPAPPHKEIDEHHDAEFPEELLSQTVGEFLDKLKEKDKRAYEFVEDVIEVNFVDNDHKEPSYDEYYDETNDKDTRVMAEKAINESIETIKANFKRFS